MKLKNSTWETQLHLEHLLTCFAQAAANRQRTAIANRFSRRQMQQQPNFYPPPPKPKPLEPLIVLLTPSPVSIHPSSFGLTASYLLPGLKHQIT